MTVYNRQMTARQMALKTTVKDILKSAATLGGPSLDSMAEVCRPVLPPPIEITTSTTTTTAAAAAAAAANII